MAPSGIADRLGLDVLRRDRVSSGRRANADAGAGGGVWDLGLLGVHTGVGDIINAGPRLDVGGCRVGSHGLGFVIF